MRIKAKLYPYPLLESCFGQCDYVDSKFNILVEQKCNKSTIELTFIPVLDNNELIDLINRGDADYAVHIECQLTSFRKLYRIKDGSLKITLNANDIEGSFTICTFIIANNDIYNYSNAKFNEDYKGFTFNIEKGNILAIGDSYDLQVNKDRDNLGNVQSIFGLIVNDNENDTDVKIDITGEKIVIALPQEEYKTFKALVKTKANQAVLHSMTLIPALMEAFDQLKKKINNGDFELFIGKKWFRSISKAFENFGIVFDEEYILGMNSFEDAQKLIKNTINRGILGLVEIVNYVGGGED